MGCPEGKETAARSGGVSCVLSCRAVRMAAWPGQGPGRWEDRRAPPSFFACLPPSLSSLPPLRLSHLSGALHPSLSLSLCVSLSLGCLPPPAEKAKSHLEVPLEENVNRRVLEEGSVEARTIEDAIAVLR